MPAFPQKLRSSFLRKQEPSVVTSLGPRVRGNDRGERYALAAVDCDNPVVSIRMPAPIVLETLTFFM